MKTTNATTEWAFGRTITGVNTGYTQVHGQTPVPYVELVTDSDAIRITTEQFTELFELGLGEKLSVCRLKNEQMRKAKIAAENAQIELTERKQLKELQEKYK